MLVQTQSKLHELARDFHQDWELSSPTAEGIVCNFRDAESPDAIEETVDEIVGALAQDPAETHLEQLWADTYQANFLPEYIGLTYREWFLRMLEILRTTPGG